MHTCADMHTTRLNNISPKPATMLMHMTSCFTWRELQMPGTAKEHTKRKNTYNQPKRPSTSKVDRPSTGHHRKSDPRVKSHNTSQQSNPARLQHSNLYHHHADPAGSSPDFMRLFDPSQCTFQRMCAVASHDASPKGAFVRWASQKVSVPVQRGSAAMYSLSGLVISREQGWLAPLMRPCPHGHRPGSCQARQRT